MGQVEPIPEVIGQKQGDTWMGCQFIAEPHKEKQTKDNCEFPIDLTCMVLDCGRKLENLEESTIQARTRTHNLLAVRGQR